MGAIYMSAGILTAIILCVVGLIKLPFDKFKKKYPKGYKATFTGLSIILTFGACLINQAFILNDKLFNSNFVILILSTYAGVFGLYLSYEGLGAKELVKRLLNALKNLKMTAPENKFIKALNKIDINQAIELVKAKEEALKAASVTTSVDEVKAENVQQTTSTDNINPIV